MADKSITIKNATDEQLEAVVQRLRKENEVQILVADLKRRSLNEFVPYDAALGISTEIPIENLYHFGVPGMKWGIRRRMRGALRRAFGKKKKIDNVSEDHSAKEMLKKRKINTLSNAELKKLNERMQLEKQYKELRVSEMSPGKRFVSQVLQGAAKQTAINFTSKAMTNQIEDIFSIKKSKSPIGNG